MQATGFDPVQLPVWQLSLCVQALPSLQAAPFAVAGFEQVPVLRSQVPARWHWSLAVQTTGVPPVQAPTWQVSPCVQALPSLQAAPFAFAGFEQVPVLRSQVPARWHWSLAVQATGVAPLQAPAWQLSLCVQALPSLQAAPSAFSGLEQVPVAGLQVPARWH